jgi:hypothetical protein
MAVTKRLKGKIACGARRGAGPSQRVVSLMKVALDPQKRAPWRV